ncbi:MAG TPA: cyclic nucleotide-binding domain-containing protein, partial [Patescibacteria group bacterium]|nr:cyclic nucleotide-binding domain-containing protein [Patescibacteria group bacterium]
MATSQPFKDYVVRFRKGERIYSVGDPGTEMYIVQSGSVEIIDESGGTRVSLAIMEKGDFFGEMALIESEPHSNTAVAIEDCDLIEINSTLFDKMIKGNIEIAVRMLRKLSIRLRDATRRLQQAASSPSREAAPVAQATPSEVAAAPAPVPAVPV